MEWLIATAVLGVIGMGVSIAQNETSISLQEESNRNTAYNTSTQSLSDSITSIEKTLLNIEGVESQNKKYQSEIDTANEWLENYRKMLSGDRTETTLGRELYGYEGALKKAENAKGTYLASSAVEKQNAYDTAFDSYSQMLKQKSLLNVAASGTGQLEGAYSMARLIQNQTIRKFIGNDMVFNSDGEATSLSDGSFLMSYSAMQKEINANIESLTLQIEIANNDIKDFYDKYETTAGKNESVVDDRTEAIEKNKQTLETYKQLIKNEQTNALTAFKKAMESRSGEADLEQLRSYGERLDALNESIKGKIGETESYSASEALTSRIAEEKKAAEERAEAARKAEEESRTRAAREAEERAQAKAKEAQRRAEKTAERDQEKGESMTDYYSAQAQAEQSRRTSTADQDKGKALTEKLKKQQEEEEKKKEEEKRANTANKEKGTNRRRVTQ